MGFVWLAEAKENSAKVYGQYFHRLGTWEWKERSRRGLAKHLRWQADVYSGRILLPLKSHNTPGTWAASVYKTTKEAKLWTIIGYKYQYDTCKTSLEKTSLSQAEWRTRWLRRETAHGIQSEGYTADGRLINKAAHCKIHLCELKYADRQCKLNYIQHHQPSDTMTAFLYFAFDNFYYLIA